MMVVDDGFLHRPALYQETLHAIQPRRGGRYVDGTLGSGGHAWGILQASSPDGLLLGLDLDPQALELAERRLSPFGSRVTILQASYANLEQVLNQMGWPSVEGILLDLGVSSLQLGTAGRGFSFQEDAPLDMRFSPQNPVNAADLVNNLPESELAELLQRYGQEPNARKIAKAIVRARPVIRTGQLVEIIGRVASQDNYSLRGRARVGGRRIHPATKTFQALRIAVNRELETLESALPVALKALSPGGRLVIIAFHSLEDRLVKQFFRRESRDCICPPRQPVCTCNHKAGLIEVTPRPIKPQSTEILSNPRARSARLRVAEKIIN